MIKSGKHRQVHLLGPVAIKVCLRQRDISHSIKEISAIRAARTSRCAKYVPKILFHDGKTGTTVMPNYSFKRTSGSVLRCLKDDLTDAGFDYKYIHGSQVRYDENGQLKLIDWGHVCQR